MSKNFWETSEFRALNKKWQKKLEKTGFKDIEEFTDYTLNKSKDTYSTAKIPSIPTDRLKKWSTAIFRSKFNRVDYEARETFFRLAGQFLHEHKFKNKLEHDVWELFSDGWTRTGIDAKLRRTEGTAKRIVLRLSDLMFRRYLSGGEDQENE